jgi:hypothetical protein
MLFNKIDTIIIISIVPEICGVIKRHRQSIFAVTGAAWRCDRATATQTVERAYALGA